MEDLKAMIIKLLEKNVEKVILSNPVKDSATKKITIKKIASGYKSEAFDSDKVFHDDVETSGLQSYILQYIDQFKQVNIWDEDYEHNLRITKKNKLIYGKSRIKKQAIINNDRQKKYILSEGSIIPPLIDLGIFTKDGKIVKSMYNKYRQINRFLEIIDDSIKLKNYKQLNVIDFGCGRSYLTFILYYYLTNVKGIKTNIIGLDLKKNVIDQCNRIASDYGYDNLKFELGDINGYETKMKVDMVITLHACDTATDYALYNAINWNAEMIFSVPCCQHEINHQIKTDNLSILTRYGIAQERLSAIYTDIIRCNLLEAMSYKTQLLEFIDFDLTPKNLLIRANLSNIPKDVRKRMINEVEQLNSTFNLKPTLYTLLEDDINHIKDKNTD